MKLFNAPNFEIFKSLLKEQLPRNIYEVWFGALKGEIKEGKVYLEVPNEFVKFWIKEHYGALLSKILKELNLIDIVYVVKEGPLKENRVEQMVIPYNPLEIIGRKISLKYTLEDFVIGKCNELAYKVCSTLVEERPKGYFIYLYGNCGLGKTHLLQGVGNGLIKRGFNYLYYFTAQDFLDYFMKYLRAGQIDNFKEKLRKGCEVFLLDGLHFLTGKDFTQRELSFLLDYLLDEGKTVVFSSLKGLQEISNLDSTLRSRLSASLMIKLNQPDFETRKKIIRFKAKKKGYEFPSEVVDYLAKNLRGDIRQLESVVWGLIARAKFLKEPITLTLAQELLQELLLKKEDYSDLEIILEGVSKFFGLGKEELFSSSRKKNLVLARQTAIYLLKTLSKRNIKEIAEALKKEHSTIIYHLKIFEKKLKENRAFKLQLEILIKELSSELGLSLVSQDVSEASKA